MTIIEAYGVESWAHNPYEITRDDGTVIYLAVEKDEAQAALTLLNLAFTEGFNTAMTIIEAREENNA